MGAKATPIQQPCPEVSLQIGQAISAMEAIAGTNWEFRDSCMATLNQRLFQLQIQYANNCSGSTKSKP